MTTRSLRVWAPLLAAALLAALVALAWPTPARADLGDDAEGRPVVLIGAPGLAWSDLEHASLGVERYVSGGVATGSLVVRSTAATACPVDGWLAVSAGNRASAPRGESDTCQTQVPIGSGENVEVYGWDDYRDRANAASFEAEPGLLGDLLDDAGVPTTAIGDGAAIALATSDGQVADLRPFVPWTVADEVSDALDSSDLVVVDIGSLSSAPGDEGRESSAESAAEYLQAVLEGTSRSGQDPVVIISGIADGIDPDPATLRLLTIAGLGDGELSSSSTRQPGYVLATDQHTTLLNLLGVDPGTTSAIGAAASIAPGSDVDALTAAAQDRERHADAQRPLIPGFFLSLVLINLALYAVVTLALRRPRFARTVADRREPVLRTMRVVSLAVAAIPVASYLTNLLPWWRFEPALLALVAGIAVVGAAIVALALLPTWRRSLLGPAAVVAGVTAIVLAIDVITGARLQVSAIMGIPTLVAGRFYGMNNTSFALFSTALLLVATAVANSLVHRNRRVLAALVVAGIGIVGIVIDGAPFLGADFGGPPAMLVAFALLALMAAGIRLSVKRVVLVVLGAGVVTMLIAFLDWLRPPASRTHLGRFFADVLSGDMWTVIGRKLDQNLTILFNNRPLTILAICGVLLVVLVLIRPVKETITSPGGGEYAWLSNGAPISAMAKQAPMLGPGLIALAINAGIGFAVNDSGIAIPAIGVALAVPLLLASCATWMLAQHDVGTQGDLDGAAHAPR